MKRSTTLFLHAAVAFLLGVNELLMIVPGPVAEAVQTRYPYLAAFFAAVMFLNSGAAFVGGLLVRHGVRDPEVK